jgi:hypothetical protein
MEENMKKTIYFILLLLVMMLVTWTPLFPEKVAALEGIANPYLMDADDGQLYVTDGASVRIYSLRDFTLQKTVGRKGEGPGEFRVNPTTNMGSVILFVYPDYLVVNSLGKVSFFTKQGELIKEMRSISPNGCFQPIGSKFVGYRFLSDNGINKLTINILDSELKQIKELYREPEWIIPGEKIKFFGIRSAFFFVSQDKIFIENQKREILILDENGRKTGTIIPDIQPLEVTETDKKRFHDCFKAIPQFRAFYETIKKDLVFPVYFPKIRFFIIADQKLYVLSWRTKEEKSECLIYDLNGKFLQKTYLPLVENNALLHYPFAINGNKIYQLIENETTNKWELHAMKM